MSRMTVRNRNHVRVSGLRGGPVVMLAHGFGCDQNMWRLVLPALEREFTVVLFDHVGAGRSDLSAWSRERYSGLDGYVEDVLEICRELDLGPVTFVGHSVSAMMGVLAAGRHPGYFDGLVLLAPSPCFIDDPAAGYRGGFTAEDIEELLQSLDANYLGWSGAMAPVIMGNPDRPELGEELTKSFCATDPDIQRVFARVTFLTDSRTDLDRVTVPPGRPVLQRRHRPAGGRSLRPGPDQGQPAGHPERDRALSPAQRPRGDRGSDRRVHTGLVLMSRTDEQDRPNPERCSDEDRAFSALLEDSAEDLYENAPCGYLSTLLDGQIAKINTTLLNWLGHRRADLVGRRKFSDLLTVGGRLYHETHFAPLLHMRGEASGIALELKAADGRRIPVLVTSTVKTGGDGRPLLLRTTVFDARDRRAYEEELLRARRESERERERLQQLTSTLQQTLLPPALANVPGLDVAAHYHIASIDEVGGDFYDLFPLAAGAWGLFLGDVCGKGAAAAAVTSLARYTLRAAAVYDPDPAAVLGNLNTVLNHEYNGNDPRFCTVVFGLLTPDEERGGFRMTLASGGHPRPC